MSVAICRGDAASTLDEADESIIVNAAKALRYDQ
jgi:hypothetical protein